MWVIKLVYVVLSLDAIKYQKRPLLSYFFSPYKLLRDCAVFFPFCQRKWARRLVNKWVRQNILFIKCVCLAVVRYPPPPPPSPLLPGILATLGFSRVEWFLWKNVFVWQWWGILLLLLLILYCPVSWQPLAIIGWSDFSEKKVGHLPCCANSKISLL